MGGIFSNLIKWYLKEIAIMPKSRKISKNSDAPEIPQPFANHLILLEEHLKEIRMFKNIFFKMLDSQHDPFSFAIDLFYYANIKFSKKNKASKLTMAILESLKEWCHLRDVSRILTTEMKIEILNRIITFINGTNFPLLNEIFHFDQVKEYVIDEVYRLISDQNFKMAYHMISALNLENEFTLESCVFPLFFLGNETFVKSYLKKVPHLIPEFIKVLDTLFQDGFKLREFIQSLNIEKLNPRSIIKDPNWIKKRYPTYIDYFEIDIKDCPNFYRQRVGAAMAYLFRRQFQEESIDYEAWEEMMLDTIKDHLDIQKNLLTKLICINEAPIAFRFAELLKIDPKDWPSVMKNIPYPIEKFSLKNLPFSPSSHEDCLSLRLELSDIHIINTPQKLFEAVDDISENYNVVGLDVEWKPNLGIYKEKASLCQLAVWDSIYLIDILALKEYQTKQIWEYLLRKIFYNKDILQLGYGADHDLNNLMRSMDLKEDVGNHNNLIDLSTFFKKLRTHYPEVAEEIERCPSNKEDEKGLSQLCQLVLGKPLNKMEQFSNWERRPLRQRQIVYAALDAYCLLMIYEKMYPVLKRKNLEITKVMETKQTPFKAEKSKTEMQIKSALIKDFKVVVDTSACGVTKYLRLLGADVVSLEDGDDHMRAVQIAQSQRRIIISSGAPFKKLSGYVPKNMCFCIDLSLNSKMQVVKILEHYQVQCQDSDIFSRCMEEPDEKATPAKDSNGAESINENFGLAVATKRMNAFQFDVEDSDDEDLDNIVFT
ncbi:exonuclease mut-7 homolog [Caerostris darwini]|uniref:Exonuclease mut-7 homolog n=1 Tax=Caerostris darwini TaxID=1538125 RepID=A0AAV4SU73_9ARAC|nr:exonuclease mut-7 homolog [Caerostris darwini]